MLICRLINKVIRSKYFSWLGYMLIAATFGLCEIEEYYTEPYIHFRYKHVEKQQELLELINSHREKNNLQVLHGDNTLHAVSVVRANYLISIDSITHEGLLRSMNKFDTKNLVGFGESLGYGYRTVQSCFKAWLASDKHKRILDNPNWEYAGITIKADKEDRPHYVLIVGY